MGCEQAKYNTWVIIGMGCLILSTLESGLFSKAYLSLALLCIMICGYKFYKQFYK